MTNEELTLEFLKDYFGDDLNEDTSEDDIIDAIYDLNHLCDSVNDYFGLNEEDDEMMDFDSPAANAEFVSAEAEAAKRRWRVGKRGKKGAHLAKQD
jgi:hypothetical protein